MTDCTVLILTYKGKHHLEDLLPSVKTAIEHSPGFTIDVLILDNGRDNETRDYVKKHFPDYLYEFSPVNDYLFSLNPYVEALHAPYFLLLNDDMKITDNIFNVLLPLIKKDPELFAINCKLLNWDGLGQQNNYRLLYIKKGWAHTHYANKTDNQIRYTLYAGGGSAIFDTVKYNQLQGFDTLFRPAYCEDIDLSHRAWKKGWKVIYHPQALIYHKETATIKEQFASKELSIKIYSNRVLWMLKNVKQTYFILLFFLYLPYRLLIGSLKSNIQLRSLLRAFPKIPGALIRRKQLKVQKISDKQLMALLGETYP